MTRLVSALRGTQQSLCTPVGIGGQAGCGLESMGSGRVGGLLTGAGGHAVESGRDRLIRTGRRMRPVPEAQLTAHGFGERAVCGAALRRQGRVGNSGARQFMAERHARRVLHDQPSLLRGFEHIRLEPERATCPSDRLSVAMPSQRSKQQRLACVGWQRLDATQVRPLRRWRQRPVEGCLGAALRGSEVARDLQQRERVAPGAFEDPLDHRRRELATERRREQGEGVRRVETAKPHLLGLGEDVV